MVIFMSEEGPSLDAILEDTAKAIALQLKQRADSGSGDLTDMVKAFELLTKYAERNKDAGEDKPKEGSKFERLNREFHGHAARSGARGRKAAKAQTGADTGTDSASTESGAGAS